MQLLLQTRFHPKEKSRHDWELGLDWATSDTKCAGALLCVTASLAARSLVTETFQIAIERGLDMKESLVYLRSWFTSIGDNQGPSSCRLGPLMANLMCFIRPLWVLSIVKDAVFARSVRGGILLRPSMTLMTWLSRTMWHETRSD